MLLVAARGTRHRHDGTRTRWLAGALALGALVAALVLATGPPGAGDGAPDGRPEPGLHRLATVPHAPRIPRDGPGLRYVSPNGSDEGTGRRGRPWRTIRRAIAGSAPGMTIALQRGAYGARGEAIAVDRSGTAAAPITFVGQRRPEVLGAFSVTGDHVRIRGIVFDGPTGLTYEGKAEEADQVSVTGDRVEIANCEIRGNRGHAGIYLQDAEQARIVGNYIHHNGDFGNPAEANLDHGIYFGSGSGTIVNNVIEGNYAFGVHLYPRPHDVLVTHNTIVHNGKSGVIVANDSTNSEVVNNVIAYNAQNAVRTFDLGGQGNIVENNLFWSSSEGDVYSSQRDGVTLRNNQSADPRFLGATDYRLGPGSPGLARSVRTGKADKDFRGRSRPRRTPGDLGAFEMP